MSKTRIKAVLLDVGGPLVDDSGIDPVWNSRLLEMLPEYIGRKVTPEELEQVYIKVIKGYTPSVYSGAIWHFVRPDVQAFRKIRSAFDTLDFSSHYRLRPEAVKVCARLAEDYTLAFAANQPESTRKYLENQGILQYFTFREMSEEMPFSKPDLRFFMYISEKIGITPEECVMVGDRQDNDIVPAKRLGMRTIRFLTGLHRIQEARMPSELPDRTIESLTELPDAINDLQTRANGL